MMKIFFLAFIGMLSISMTFAQEATCLPRGSECLGASLGCCKPTTCMFYANRCVGDGLIIPDEQPPRPAVEAPKPGNCLARGSECLGSNLECCKGTTCMFYANRCVLTN
ncbi:uncharacterized protein LOC129950161 [Eupeodes corollae]|uniref:uncharacterized protein LOC129950161 n=1 Tax=Eupeodes corollae TaxID=290404 RepID=UPI00248F9139|nr:uncharacterized protein LOC129950161 [Eupeodes corollae]